MWRRRSGVVLEFVSNCDWVLLPFTSQLSLNRVSECGSAPGSLEIEISDAFKIPEWILFSWRTRYEVFKNEFQSPWFLEVLAGNRHEGILRESNGPVRRSQFGGIEWRVVVDHVFEPFLSMNLQSTSTEIMWGRYAQMYRGRASLENIWKSHP